MSLGPDDRALAARLLEHDVVPLGDLLRAIGSATEAGRDLATSLVGLGLVDRPTIERIRAAVEVRPLIGTGRPASRRGDTVRDVPVPRAPSRPVPPPHLDAAPEPGREEDDTIAGIPAITALPPMVLPLSPARVVVPVPRPGPTAPPAPALSPPPAPAPPAQPPPAPAPPAQPRSFRASLPVEVDLERLDAVDPRAPDGRGPIGLLARAAESAADPGLGTEDSGDILSSPTMRLQDTIFERGHRLELGGASRPTTPHVNAQSAQGEGRSARAGLPSPRVEGVEVPVVREKERLAPSGKRLDERYLMLGEIGRGGMGRILKARDTEIGREVALKVLLGGAEVEEHLIRRFWLEVQATGQLEHPSIIPIHDVGRLPSGELFYVMKKLSGRTLAEVIAALADGRLSEAEFSRARLLTIFQQICYAVAFAHARGVIHRDIKPANIMVGRYGEAMLLDWGLAKLVEGVRGGEVDEPPVVMHRRQAGGETASGTIAGTPQYMSPEATTGEPERLTTKSDVYGLGAVLYEILTWSPVFQDEGFASTVLRVSNGEFALPRQRAPERAIPVELEELCLVAMARDPLDRPTAKQLADDIGRILEGAKERERRAQEARARVREGRRALDRWRSLKVELQAAESEAKKLAKEVPPWAPIERKQPMWALEDRVSELKIEAISAFEEGEAAFLRALGEVPDDRDARGALAALYFARFGEAERARDFEGQRYYQSLVARYDDGLWARVLVGAGSLEIITEPSDVAVVLSRMEQVNRLLRPVEPRPLGRAPIARFELPIGSYLLTLKRPEEREIYRPVLIGRTEAVSVHVTFRSASEIGDDFVLVPEGPAILGGDPIAHGGLERRVVEVGEMAIGRFPVTCEEYLAFINAIAEDSVEEAMRHVPRARAQEGHYWRYDPGRRRFEYPEKSPGGHSVVGHLPVTAISMMDALAYITWRSARTGERLRLPHENEWEKAARGVDGRFFPWGDHFDPTFCKMKDSRDRPYPEPEPVGAFPTDRSPYGVRDMAGGVRELCLTDEGGDVRPVMRGGCWSDTGLFCRVAFRHVTQPDFVNTGLGFRLVKDVRL